MLKTCIIIEDQPPAQRILQKYIADLGSLELMHTFNNALEAIPYLQQNSIDIVFLDIHLPKISGIDFLKTLQNSPNIILTTAFSDYAIESYEYNVVDYLLKPFSFQRFVKAIAKANNKTTPQPQEIDKEQLKTPVLQTFLIKSGYDLIKIKSDDIMYIHSDSDYTEVATKDKKIISSDSLKQWLEKLTDNFLQTHKSYIVNSNYISKVSGNQVFILESEQKIPIGRSFKERFIEKIKS